MNPDDEQFEGYLKTFRPVDPPPLQGRRNLVNPRRSSAMAAAIAVGLAAAVLLAILLFRIRGRSPSTQGSAQITEHVSSSHDSLPDANLKGPEIGTPALTRLAFDDTQAFNRLMTEKLRTQLPPMTGERSTLRVLAKE